MGSISRSLDTNIREAKEFWNYGRCDLKVNFCVFLKRFYLIRGKDTCKKEVIAYFFTLHVLIRAVREQDNTISL